MGKEIKTSFYKEAEPRLKNDCLRTPVDLIRRLRMRNGFPAQRKS